MLFLLFSVIGYFASSTAKIVIMIAVTILCLGITAILVAKKAFVYPIICVVLASLMIVASTVSSYFFFQKRERLNAYEGTQCMVEAMVVSTKYLTTNIGGYEIIVSSVNGEKLFHRAILNCSYDAALDDGDRIVVSATAEGFDTITGSYNEELSMLSDGIFLSYSSSEPDSLMLTDTDVFHPRIFQAVLCR